MTPLRLRPCKTGPRVRICDVRRRRARSCDVPGMLRRESQCLRTARGYLNSANQVLDGLGCKYGGAAAEQQ
jgi:hypothetical protein